MAEIPDFLKHLKTHMGFPVTAITHIRDDGTPDFKITDQAKWNVVTANEWCGICGHPLGYWKYFIGGPACVTMKIFYDPAMHQDCALYSLKTCPFLSNQDARYAETYKIDPNERVTVIPMSGIRPDKMALYRCRNYRVGIWHNSPVLFAAPPQEVTWFP